MVRSGSGKLTLRAIEALVAVVEEGSFALGARRLSASSSSVSQQISNLEAALGARLIERSARPLALTPAGYVFQRRALAILDEAARARSELAELEMTRLPQLRISTIEEFDAEVVPEFVFRLTEMLPECNIVAHTGPSHANLTGLEGRQTDLAIAADIDNPPEWIEQHPLLRDPYILATAKGLLADSEDPLARLLAAPMVRFAATQLMGRQIEAHLRRLRLAPPRRCEFESNASVLAAAARLNGWAITTIPGYLRAPSVHPALEVRPLPFKGFARVLALHARRDVMGTLPSRAAGILRTLIDVRCVEPAVREMPWLVGRLRTLGHDEPPPRRLRAVGS